MKQIYSVLTAMAVCLYSDLHQLSSLKILKTPCLLAGSPAILTTQQRTKASIKKAIAFINNGTSTLGTPFLDFTAGSFTISFNYALSGNLPLGNRTRSFQIGYQDKTGAFIGLTGTILL